jgi:hypothetical protein
MTRRRRCAVRDSRPSAASDECGTGSDDHTPVAPGGNPNARALRIT